MRTTVIPAMSRGSGAVDIDERRPDREPGEHQSGNAT
jgi:hypothetical protein